VRIIANNSYVDWNGVVSRFTTSTDTGAWKGEMRTADNLRLLKTDSILVDGTTIDKTGHTIRVDTSKIVTVTDLSDGLALKATPAQVSNAIWDSLESAFFDMRVALSTAANNISRGIYDITYPPYSADGTGNVDATTVIQAACDAAFTASEYGVYGIKNTKVIGSGKFLISSTIRIRTGADLGLATFETANTSDTAIVWIDAVGNYFDNTVVFPRVINISGAENDGTWTGNSVGIALINGRSNRFYIQYVSNFVTGVLLTNYGAQGFRSNTIYNGEVRECKIGYKLSLASTAGWVNENKIQGGGISLWTPAETPITGAYAILLDSTDTHEINGSTFEEINVEGYCWQWAVVCYGAYNTFRDFRWEAANRVKWGYDVSSDQEAMHNGIEGGYDSQTIVYTYEKSTGTRRNYYVGPLDFYNTGNITAGTGITAAMLHRMMYYNGNSAINC
jgi:hypothetical protein